jgi:hemerythrin
MEHFEWKDEYSVGDSALDAQHRELIRIMNSLYALLQGPQAGAGAGADAVEPLFESLADYIATHFAYEENRMSLAAYPIDQLAAHRAEHDKLVRQVRGFQAEIGEGRFDRLRDLLPYLYGEWLINHICHQDMGYRPYLERK